MRERDFKTLWPSHKEAIELRKQAAKYLREMKEDKKRERIIKCFIIVPTANEGSAIGLSERKPTATACDGSFTVAQSVSTLASLR